MIVVKSLVPAVGVALTVVFEAVSVMVYVIKFDTYDSLYSNNRRMLTLYYALSTCQ